MTNAVPCHPRRSIFYLASQNEKLPACGVIPPLEEGQSISGPGYPIRIYWQETGIFLTGHDGVSPFGGDLEPRHAAHISCNIHTISALRSLFGISVDGMALFPQVPLLPFRTLVSRSPIACGSLAYFFAISRYEGPGSDEVCTV